MPLRDDLLNPVPGANPAGENLRYAPVYDKIKEARREDDDAPQGEWQRERKVADWPLVIKLASETLATKSKDLQLAAWLAEAMLRREGMPGLKASLELVRGLIDNFWDNLYPELEDGDAEFRATPLQWIGDRLEIPLKRVPFTRGGLDFFQYRESRAVPTEEQAGESDEKASARKAALEDGKTTPEDFDKDFAATPKAFYQSLEQSHDEILELLAALSELCDEKFGDVSPSFGSLRKALEETRQAAHILLVKKRETEPDAAPEPEPELEAESEPEAQPELEAASDATPTPAAAPAPRARPKAGALSAEPADRDDAVARVVSAARFLRQNDISDPTSYLLLRGLRWGELRAAGVEIDERALAAPPTELRQKLKAAAMDSNWADVLETAETAMGMECGRGWLDLQRFVYRAAEESWYEPLKLAILSAVRGFLEDYPNLPSMMLMDDTPTANAETMAWLSERVFPPQAEADAASARPEAEPEPAPAPYFEPAPKGAAAPPDTFELAMQAARSGRAQEGMEMLMVEMGQERSGRGRFHRKVQLAQLCVSVGHDGIAFPLLQEVAAEIERRKLEEWEDAGSVAQPLALLYHCLGKSGGSPEERQKLYGWICRLDPLAALKVSK